MVVLLIDKAIRYRFFSDLGDLFIIVAGKRIMYIYIYINLQNVCHRPNASLKQQTIGVRNCLCILRRWAMYSCWVPTFISWTIFQNMFKNIFLTGRSCISYKYLMLNSLSSFWSGHSIDREEHDSCISEWLLGVSFPMQASTSGKSYCRQRKICMYVFFLFDDSCVCIIGLTHLLLPPQVPRFLA